MLYHPAHSKINFQSESCLIVKSYYFQLDFNDKLNFSPQLLSSDKQVNTSIPQGGNRRREDKSFGNYSEIGNKEKLQKNRST